MKYIKPLIIENIYLESDSSENKVWSDETMKKLDRFKPEQKIRYMLNKHPNAQTHDMYYFLAKPTFIEKEVDGEMLYKKSYNIENLYLMDKNNPDMMAVSFMKMRMMQQGDETKLYQVWLPIGNYGQNTYMSDLESSEIDLIMKHSSVVK